jgi:DNA mismatch endonuclease, patch repair protein
LRSVCSFVAIESVFIRVHLWLKKMPDVFTKAKRSEVMSRIRSRGNKATELALAKLLRVHGIAGWRRQVEIRGRAALRRGPNIRAAPQRRPTLRVRPDFIFPKLKLALFVDGCFWHGCPRHATQPRNNRAFWQKKLADNRRRDVRVTRALRRSGWRVVRIWECALQRATKHEDAARRLLRPLQQVLP